MRYLPCELHCHTIHSDGGFTPAALLNEAHENGLALIALTDHNTISGWEELDDKITPSIRGIEWTTYFGHMLVLGAKKYVDWRDATPENIDEKIKEVKLAGGIVGIAHPLQLGSPICSGGRWDFSVQNWDNVDYIEIWHNTFSPNNFENKPATKMWTELLDEGFHIAASYGRDWHNKSNGNFGCTYLGIDGEINEKNALEAIKLGRTVVSFGAKFFFRVHQFGTTFSIGETIREGRTVFSFFTDLYAHRENRKVSQALYTSIKIITNGNHCVREVPVTERHVHIDAVAGNWYRCELWGTLDETEQPLAITSPVYTEL